MYQTRGWCKVVSAQGKSVGACGGSGGGGGGLDVVVEGGYEEEKSKRKRDERVMVSGRCSSGTRG